MRKGELSVWEWEWEWLFRVDKKEELVNGEKRKKVPMRIILNFGNSIGLMVGNHTSQV